MQISSSSIFYINEIIAEGLIEKSNKQLFCNQFLKNL